MVVIYNSGSIVALIIIIIMFLVGELTSTRSISIDNGTLNIAYYFHNETIKISEIKYMRKINLMENSKYKTRIIFKNNAIKDFIRPFLFSKKDINYLINEINKPWEHIKKFIWRKFKGIGKIFWLHAWKVSIYCYGSRWFCAYSPPPRFANNYCNTC